MDNGLNIKVNMNKKRVLVLIFLVLLLIPGLVSIAFSGEKILHSKIKSISPEKTDGQYCFIKIIIKQKDDEIIKEEILECADGKRELIHQVIGSYLLNFTTEIFRLQNTV